MNRKILILFCIFFSIPLKAEADLKIHTPDYDLYLGAMLGDLDQVMKAMKQGANVNAKDEFGQTPLYMAINKNHDEVAIYLIGKNADLRYEYKNGNDKDILNLAISKGNIKLIKLIINKGIKVDDGSMTHALVGSPEVLQAVLDSGADVNMRLYTLTPLLLACANNYENKDNGVKILKLLVEKGADINATIIGPSLRYIETGNNCLHFAAIMDSSEKISFLIGKIKINSRNNKGYTPLHYAAFLGNVAAVKALIAAGADINALNNDKLTPLQLATNNLNKLQSIMNRPDSQLFNKPEIEKRIQKLNQIISALQAAPK